MSQQIKHLNEENVRTILKWINLSASIDEKIDDLNIRTDAVFSSKKVSELAQDVKHSLEQYIQSSINGLTHLKKKIVDTLPSDADAEENILYLVKDTSVVDDVVYNQYLLIDGTLEPLGSTNTDMSNYYNKDESDAKFALLSNLQTLIDMIGSVSDLETTAKDTLVNAINEIKEGLDDCITKDAIVTTIDDTVTDEQIPSALTVYDKLKDNNIKTFATLDQLGLSSGCDVTEIVNTMPDHSYAEIGCYNATNSYGLEFVTGLPNGEANFILTIRKYNYHRVDIQAKSSASGAVMNDLFIGGMVAGGTSVTWQKVCTTGVKDVANTNVTSYMTNTSNGTITYSVKDGWCTLNVARITPTSSSVIILPAGYLPLPDISSICHFPAVSSSGSSGLIVINSNGQVNYYGLTTVSTFASITYKVADN